MNGRSIKLALVAACFVLVAACAPLTKVTLLQQADGSKSAVLVTSGKSEQLLTSPYQQAIGQENKALKLDNGCRRTKSAPTALHRHAAQSQQIRFELLTWRYEFNARI
jgi:hypothetical protein